MATEKTKPVAKNGIFIISAFLLKRLRKKETSWWKFMWDLSGNLNAFYYHYYFRLCKGFFPGLCVNWKYHDYWILSFFQLLIKLKIINLPVGFEPNPDSHRASASDISFRSPPQALLKYNWHITLCKFKVYSVVIWYMYILQNDYHSKVG